MSGYTPLFQSLTTGTLCGKWPDIGLWPIVLSLADKNGVVDVTAAYIAGITGLPVDDVTACMGRFCMPDPGSRSADNNGARLVLLEAHRDWGWVIVNHGKYREKARLSAKSARESADGINAKRMADRRRPPETAADPLSNANANTVRDMSSSSTAGGVFDHWKAEYGHPKAKLDAKRTRVISAALKNYSADDLKRAISGYKHSKHHMGQNETKTVYDDVCLFLRDATHIDAGLKFADKGSEVKWL